MAIESTTAVRRSAMRFAACAGLALALAGTGAAAVDSVKDGARKVGHGAGSVVREIGQGAKRAGKSIGGAAKEGGREFRRALKGKSD
jgi:hypothetical protein